MNKSSIAIVVPMYNEASNIERFFDRLVPAMTSPNVALRIICVDDGSSDDGVARVTRRLRTLPEGACVVQLSRNFGKEAALLAGLDAALKTDCDAVVMIDADLQHPPEAITALMEAWKEGSEVVIASRTSRAGDSISRRFMTRRFYRLINWLSDIPMVDGDGDFRLLSRAAVEALCSLREQHRFTKGLYSWIGFPVARIPIEFESREAGASKFRLGHLIALAVNAITSFSVKPLRLAIIAGLIIGALSLATGTWITFQTFVHGRQVPGYASIFCGMMFLGGAQLIGIGVLGEYVGRTYIESKSRPPYMVRRVISQEKQ
ncbi:glycosyltransferase family 2 protein [Dyella soli]|uniref:Glycosyltransferase n=1 Tax=Dyella soli TaxID=522319 RepID=A0A4V2NM02_9GAMM|nr:glycosyltransferase family 2 protein [Dyella soli]TCI11121.1 glycosyltransferase [Dyella soli]